jgi:hypothetical protein
VGLRAGVDTEAREKIEPPVIQSVVRHYTDFAAKKIVYKNTTLPLIE